ncbi:hypothetical protein GCM10022237_38450 [Nocardioides ginsengisoli]|uniref:Uncharacterized protein n=1 Tax=Nocardioides ginsengisoli TaxID=363868 RepID=A0ABW3VX46_9ACTN
MPGRFLILALIAAIVGLSPAPAGAHAPSDAACDSGQVMVVVDFNQLGGPTRSACAKAGGSAAQLFDAAGFALTYTSAPGMQGFVCTVADKPIDRNCTQGDSYWSLWWSDGSKPWAYATLGVDQLEVPARGYVGFAWHQGSGDATAPDLAVGTTSIPVREPEPEPDRAEADNRGGFPAWLGIGLAVVVLGAAGAVPILRRRR